MLKDSLIEQRAKEVSESRSFIKDQEYIVQFNKVAETSEAIKRIIPENITNQFNCLFDDYIVENDKMHLVIEREAYKQGIIDGIEINKLLNLRRDNSC